MIYAAITKLLILVVRYKSNNLSHRLWKMTNSPIKAACLALVFRSFTRLLNHSFYYENNEKTRYFFLLN